MRMRRLALLALGILALAPALASAQPAPYHRYRTLATPHFRVHVAAGMEREGRVATAAGEDGYRTTTAHWRFRRSVGLPTQECRNIQQFLIHLGCGPHAIAHGPGIALHCWSIQLRVVIARRVAGLGTRALHHAH